jgi:F0F1-type ATP synthase membrane subunit c/vacuolar-type H+-ATPase subunit K
VVALASGFAITGACMAAARQPFFANKIQMLSIIILTLTETPVFFALIIALFMKNNFTSAMALAEGIKLLCVGLLFGAVSVGPSVGQMIFAKDACLATGINRQAYPKIFTFSVLTEAFIETPVLFAFVLAIFMMLKNFILSPMIATSVFFSTALVVSLGALGVGIGIGLVASNSVKKIAANPEGYTQILQTSILSSIFIETSSIFCFFVALLMLIKAVSL